MQVIDLLFLSSLTLDPKHPQWDTDFVSICCHYQIPGVFLFKKQSVKTNTYNLEVSWHIRNLLNCKVSYNWAEVLSFTLSLQIERLGLQTSNITPIYPPWLEVQKSIPQEYYQP